MKAWLHIVPSQKNAIQDIRKDPELHKHPHYRLQHPLINSIYAHTKQWQEKTNQKDPLTCKMVDSIQVMSKKLHKDNCVEMLTD